MSGNQVRAARTSRGWNQQYLAKKVSVSQGYVSLLERNRRPVPRRLAAKLASVLEMSATTLPLGETTPLKQDHVPSVLGTLGYPGFEYLRTRQRLNPAEVLFRTLQSDDVDGRVVEALPWLVMRYHDLNWDWLVPLAKQHDLQNRLGFVVSAAKRLAENRGDVVATTVLGKWELVLEHSRLQKQDTFSRRTMTESEKKWLQVHGSPNAKRWNLLSSLSTEMFHHATHPAS